MPTATDNIMATFEWNNHIISLARDGSFFIEVDGSADAFQSLQEARTALDAADKRRDVVKREKISLKVFSSLGKEHLITGIHASTGRLLVKPEINRYAYPDLYPDTPHVRTLVQKQLLLQDELSEVEHALGAFNITKEYRAYNRQLNIEVALADLKAEFQRKSSAGDA